MMIVNFVFYYFFEFVGCYIFGIDNVKVIGDEGQQFFGFYDGWILIEDLIGFGIINIFFDGYNVLFMGFVKNFVQQVQQIYIKGFIEGGVGQLVQNVLKNFFDGVYWVGDYE